MKEMFALSLGFAIRFLFFDINKPAIVIIGNKPTLHEVFLAVANKLSICWTSLNVAAIDQIHFAEWVVDDEMRIVMANKAQPVSTASRMVYRAPVKHTDRNRGAIV